MYKLIVSDLDGTIFDKTYTVSEELRHAVEKARAKGCAFSLATGRLYPSAVQFAYELGVTVPIIAYNGALIRDPFNNETVLEKTISLEKAKEILSFLLHRPVMKFVFIDDVVYTDVDEEMTSHYAAALRVKFVHVPDLAGVLTKSPLMIALRAEPEIISGLTKMLRDHYGHQLYFANSRPFFLDIANPQVSKGRALEYLCQRLGISLAETIAIGDERNDLEMMEIAGLGGAVGNAEESVKKKADYLAQAEYWRGVIEIIERFVLSSSRS